MPKPKREAIASAPPPNAQGGAPSPEKIPTYAQHEQYLAMDAEGEEFRFTQEQERALLAEGIWPERQWSIWKHAMQRGVQAY